MKTRNKWLQPITFWAGLGAVFIVLQLYCYLRWIFSDNFKPVAPGTHGVPAYSQISIIAFEAVSMLALVVAIIWFIRGIKKTGKINTTRLMMIGWLSAYWLDPFLNYLKPMFTYNTSLVNFGSWANFIPGYMAPNGEKIAEPLLVNPANYFMTFAITTMAVVWIMKKIKEKFPNTKLWVQILSGFPVVWVVNSILDVVATRYFNFDAWLIGNQNLSLWGGKFYQFPLSEFITFPLIFIAGALLVYYQDENGHTAVERDYDQLGLADWKITLLRILAVIAFVNLLNWSYTALSGLIALGGDPWPANVPNWISDQQIPFLK